MTERALSEEAMLASLQDIELPAHAAGGVLADVAALVGLACLVALLFSGMFRLLGSRTRPSQQRTTQERLAALHQLSDADRRVALLHLLRDLAPDRYATIKGALYAPAGGVDLAALEARAAKLLELADPWILLALPLPFLALRLLAGQQILGGAIKVPDRVGQTLIVASGTQVGSSGPWSRQGLLWMIWALTLFAAAGPRDLAPVSALKVTGRDLAIVLDLSGSMVRDDFYLDDRQITRLDAVKTVGAEFARRRGGDRVALIVFGSEAYYASPFTFDVEAVAQRIEGATIGISGRATNISDGLGLAVKRMADSAAASRVVILLSDGVNNAGATNPRGVAELAASLGIRVHTIALGPKDLSTAEAGERGVVDAATLRAISEVSGGESFRVKTTDDLTAVAEALDRLEGTDSAGLAAEVFRDYWMWPAGLAICLGVWLGWREVS